MIYINENQKKQPKELKALTLAYMGDAVFEVFVREYVISKGGSPNILHKLATKYVSAKAQAKIIHYLMERLSEEEIDVVKRGRNAKSHTSPKNANITDYRYSTGFEALIGYLYLMDQKERLEEIIINAIEIIEKDNDEDAK